MKRVKNTARGVFTLRRRKNDRSLWEEPIHFVNRISTTYFTRNRFLFRPTIIYTVFFLVGTPLGRENTLFRVLSARLIDEIPQTRTDGAPRFKPGTELYPSAVLCPNRAVRRRVSAIYRDPFFRRPIRISHRPSFLFWFRPPQK